VLAAVRWSSDRLPQGDELWDTLQHGKTTAVCLHFPRRRRRRPNGRRRKMSVAARKRISEAQKARWTKLKARGAKKCQARRKQGEQVAAARSVKQIRLSRLAEEDGY
jgi:hypothetical protein